jgi:periplasmic protein TonB
MWTVSETSRYQNCFIFSLLLHGTAVAASFLLFSNLRLAEQPEPFRWNVGVVQDPAAAGSRATTQPVPSSAVEAARETHPPHTADNKPVRPKIGHGPATNSQQHADPGPSISPSPMKPESRAATPQPDSPPKRELEGASSSPAVPPTSQATVVEQSREVSASPDRRAQMDEHEMSSIQAPAVRAAEESPRPPHEESPAPASVLDEPRAAPSPAKVASPSLSSIRDIDATAPQFSPKGGQDLAWLGDALRHRLQQSHKYSTVARLNGLEGRVVLRVTVRENGELLVALGHSSGHDVLDRDAVEAVQRLSPLPLHSPLGRAQQSLNLPITYTLDR